jgi:molybdenum-dependent DNA-binding transcriptional regulator ModE
MKHWFSVTEASEVMGCSTRTTYRRLQDLEKRLGRPVLVTRVSQGRQKTVVSSIDLSRINGSDEKLTELLGIKEQLEATNELLERLMVKIAAVARKVGA